MQLSLVIRTSIDRGNSTCKTFKVVDCYYSNTAAKKLKKFLDSQVPLDLRSHRYHFVRIVNILDAPPQAVKVKPPKFIIDDRFGERLNQAQVDLDEELLLEVLPIGNRPPF